MFVEVALPLFVPRSEGLGHVSDKLVIHVLNIIVAYKYENIKIIYIFINICIFFKNELKLRICTLTDNDQTMAPIS